MIGVPSNDFGGQEPSGINSAKEAVIGPNAHPFYRWAAQGRPVLLAMLQRLRWQRSANWAMME